MTLSECHIMTLSLCHVLTLSPFHHFLNSLQHVYTGIHIGPGGAVGLLAQVTIEDQKKWDGKGSLPGAVGKSGTPLPSTLLTDLQTDLTVYVCVYAMFICTVCSSGCMP